MRWLQCGNNTVTACPRQVIVFWKCQSSPPPPPPPPPKKKKMHSHSFQFLPGDAVVTRDIKDSAQAIFGVGGLKVGINKAYDRRFKSGDLCCFPVSFFFVLFSWPYKLMDRYKSNKLMIFRVGNTWQSITSQELINLWPSTCKCPQERHFPDQWSRWKSKERGTCIT